MEINYTRNGDYLLPDLQIYNDNKNDINRYGLLRLEYIKRNNKQLYNNLLYSGKLNEYISSVSKECNTKFKTMMDNYRNNDNRLSETYKAINQIEWIQLMNNYKNAIDEVILKEDIYI